MAVRHSGAIWRTALLAAGFLLVGSLGTQAKAVVVDRTDEDVISFSGLTCGATQTESGRLPAGSFQIEPSGPAVGATLQDITAIWTIGRITGVSVRKDDSGHPVVTYTATGSGDLCPDASSVVENDTDLIDTTVDYAIHDNVYFAADCSTPRYRPTRIIIACGDGNLQLKRIRWRRWSDSGALGSATAWVNDCKPYCAVGHFHNYAATVSLSHRTYCSNTGRYQFVDVRYGFPNGRPAGLRGEKFRYGCGFKGAFKTAAARNLSVDQGRRAIKRTILRDYDVARGSFEMPCGARSRSRVTCDILFSDTDGDTWCGSGAARRTATGRIRTHYDVSQEGCQYF